MAKANDMQVGGQHYNHAIAQHWDIVDMHKLDYFQGQITKYVMRWKRKGGLQDLLKAQHFLAKYIELNNAGNIPESGAEPGRGYVDQDADRVVARVVAGPEQIQKEDTSTKMQNL